MRLFSFGKLFVTLYSELTCKPMERYAEVKNSGGGGGGTWEHLPQDVDARKCGEDAGGVVPKYMFMHNKSENEFVIAEVEYS